MSSISSDEDDDLLGQHIYNYEVISKLGEGSFGMVYKVQHIKSMVEYALKFSIEDLHGHGGMMQEVEVLEKIKVHDPENKTPILKLIDCFQHEGKLCMVFPLMAQSLQKACSLQRLGLFSQTLFFTRDQIRRIGYQILQGLNFLHKSGIIHTDIKADNIMLTNSSSTDAIKNDKICIIDMGMARFDHQDKKTKVSNKYYQAPEIILDFGYDTCSDIWAAGIVLFEMWSGKFLFRNNSDTIRLATMEILLGPPPVDYVSHNKDFYPEGSIDFTALKDVSSSTKPLECYVGLEDGSSDEQFINLMRCLWEWNHFNRMSAHSLLEHPFFEGMAALYGRGYENTQKDINNNDIIAPILYAKTMNHESNLSVMNPSMNEVENLFEHSLHLS